jgi:hypothetical protein
MTWKCCGVLRIACACTLAAAPNSIVHGYCIATGLHFGRTCVALIAICFIPEGPMSMLLAQECLDDTVRNCNHFLVRRRLWRSQSPSERPCRNMCISNSKRDCDLRRPVRSKRWATRLMIPKTQIGVLIGSQRRDYQKTSMAARVDGQR